MSWKGCEQALPIFAAVGRELERAALAFLALLLASLEPPQNLAPFALVEATTQSAAAALEPLHFRRAPIATVQSDL